MQIIGIDPARPGADETVMVIRGSMSSAIEVEHRLAHYNRRMGNVHDRLRQFSSELFEQMLTLKVPLIKYGRRKRGKRRMFPPMRKITINCGS